MNLRQEAFKNIKYYYDEIKRHIIRIGLCKRWTAEEIHTKTKEAFMCNLSRKTLYEMTKSNINDPLKILEVLERAEKVRPENFPWKASARTRRHDRSEPEERLHFKEYFYKNPRIKFYNPKTNWNKKDETSTGKRTSSIKASIPAKMCVF